MLCSSRVNSVKLEGGFVDISLAVICHRSEAYSDVGTSHTAGNPLIELVR